MTETPTREKPRLDTSHRVYAVVVAAVVFCVSWATVAAKPWVAAKPDPRLAALVQREQRLRADAKLVQQVVDHRMAAYRLALAARKRQIAAAQTRAAAAAPQVRVVNLPPLTITRTS
jgi:hypothetical protein